MNNIIAILILSALMLLFYSFFAFCYKIAMRGTSWTNVLDTQSRSAYLTFAFAILLLCAYLLSKNHFVYYWDYGGYWTLSYTQMKEIFEDPIFAFQHLISSIWYDDYNLLLPTLVAIPLKVFGYTFNRYVLINILLFFIPLVFILLSICIRITYYYSSDTLCRYNEINHFKIVGSLFLIVTFNVFYLAVLKGYIDIAALIPASMAILLFVDYDSNTFNKNQLIRDVCIAGCLLCIFLFRRYFAYFVVGYICSLTCYSFYKAFASNRIALIKNIRNAALNLIVIAFVGITIMMIFFRTMLIHILTTRYSEEYVGYDTSLFAKTQNVIRYFGLLNVVLALLGIVISFITKQYRKISSFCGILLVVTTALFFRVQSMDVHHIYTIALEFFLLQFLCIKIILDQIKIHVYRVVICVILILLCACNSLNCFFPKMRKIFAPISIAFTRQYDPFQRNDIDTLRQMVDYINSLTYGTDKSVYIDASGSILNNSIIESLNKPYGASPLRNQCQTADVDLRDGFPTDFLTAGIIVTTDPIQLHLAEGTQEVVRFLSVEVADPNSPIGQHFIKDKKSFVLDGGVRVDIYIKNSEFSRSDLQYLADYYTNYYHGQETLFADRIIG